MQGSIRFVLGLLLVWGSVGSMDYANGTQLLMLVVIAAVGLYTMYSGAQALKDQ
jgi:uncharacterized membrane protein